MIVVTVATYQRLKDRCPGTAQLAAAVGLIQAGLLLASVQVFNYGMDTVVRLFATAPEQAVAAWQVIESVALALGGSGGQLVGGVWVLLVSAAALRAKEFPSRPELAGRRHRHRRNPVHPAGAQHARSRVRAAHDRVVRMARDRDAPVGWAFPAACCFARADRVDGRYVVPAATPAPGCQPPHPPGPPGRCRPRWQTAHPMTRVALRIGSKGPGRGKEFSRRVGPG